MNEGEQERDQQYALPPSAEDDLRATVQITLQNVLLKQGPHWNQEESPSPRPGGELETRDKHDQRHAEDRRQQQELCGGEKVVEPEAEVVRSFIVDAMRKDHQRECEGDRNGERGFVRAEESQHHPLRDQTRDEYRHDLPQSESRSA